VPRHVDLGNDRDEALRRVGDEILVLLLRVETAWRAADFGLPALPGEVGPLLDLDPPALIVGEMQVQPVHLVQRDQIDVPLDVVRREEVARDVEHGAAPREARRVGDPQRGQLHLGRCGKQQRLVLRRWRQQLSDGLGAVENADRRRGGQRDPLRVDGQIVAFGPERLPRGIERDLDPVRGSGRRRRQREPCRAADPFGEITRAPRQRRVGRRDDDGRRRADLERRARLRFDLRGKRYEVGHANFRRHTNFRLKTEATDQHQPDRDATANRHWL
jgi:hypothetical protein